MSQRRLEILFFALTRGNVRARFRLHNIQPECSPIDDDDDVVRAGKRILSF